MITSEDIGKIVSFSIYPVGIIPTVFSHVKVLDILSPSTASELQDVATLHANVKPTLPVGSPVNYNDYNYLRVQFENKTKAIIGLPWIVASSIVVHENTQISVIISDVNAGDVTRVREALIANGFNSLAISLL